MIRKRDKYGEKIGEKLSAFAERKSKKFMRTKPDEGKDKDKK